MGLFNSKKDNRHFTEKDFIDNFPKEVSVSLEVYEQMLENGFIENALAEFDYTFDSNSKEKLLKLSNFLKKNYNHNLKSCKKENSIWILEGTAPKLPINEDGLLNWALDLYNKGYEFDCVLNGYGSFTDPKDLAFLNLENETCDTYFEKGISKIENRNFGEAVIYLSIALQFDPNNEEVYQARGYCKDELKTFKAARQDYDKAIEINPNYVEALLLRGANFDDNEEFDSALSDYNKVIEIESDNGSAFLNRGNTKFSLGDKKGACIDWKTALSLGVEEAQNYIDEECN
jgi:tetratricopeptide (TPR) repeat protein